MGALAAGRQVTLYLLSFFSVAGAEIAWRDASPWRLATLAASLAFAMVLGGLLADALSGAGSGPLRRHARLVLFALFPAIGLITLTTALAGGTLAARGTEVLVLLHLATLLLCEALRLDLLAVWSTLVLTIAAALAGGPPANVGLPAWLLLASLFFAFDHVASRIAPWPNLRAPHPARVALDALRQLALPFGLLALSLAALPPSESAGASKARAAVLATPEVRRAYEWLVVLALVGGGSVAAVFHWLRGDGKDALPLEEMADSHVEAEEPLEPSVMEDARYAATRGRIIKAYVRFLEHARDTGLRLERHLTPREIEGRVLRPALPLDTLTGLFVDARYGPDEPSVAAARDAESAAQVLIRTLAPRATRRFRFARGIARR